MIYVHIIIKRRKNLLMFIYIWDIRDLNTQDSPLIDK